MKMNGVDYPDWEHVEAGFYRRLDRKGSTTQFGSHEWSVCVDVGDGMVDTGSVGFSGENARYLIDTALSKGKIPSLPRVTPGILAEQVTEKIRQAGFSSSIRVRAGRVKGAERVVLGVDGGSDVSIVLNKWGMKAGQQSYQVFVGTSREPISNHDDERWRYPQKGEAALDAAVATAVKAITARRLKSCFDP
jgi:hypothetical protein